MDQTVSCLLPAIMSKGLIVIIHSAYGLTGLSRGGQQVGKCKEVFGKAVKLLVELASLQVHFNFTDCSLICVCILLIR